MTDEFAGKTALVTTAIGGMGRPGEVQVQNRGGTETYIAHCEEPIARGEQVLILEHAGGRTLIVTGVK